MTAEKIPDPPFVAELRRQGAQIKSWSGDQLSGRVVYYKDKKWFSSTWSVYDKACATKRT